MIYGPGPVRHQRRHLLHPLHEPVQLRLGPEPPLPAANDPNRGYWYVVQVPAGVSGSIDINVFDASYNHDAATKIMDSTEGSGTPDFETEFKVYKQTNPLDFTVRSNVFTSGSGSNNPTDGGCWWGAPQGARVLQVLEQALHDHRVQPGDTYLVNVRTNTVGRQRGRQQRLRHRGGSTATGTPTPTPSIYAYADMGMANQNQLPIRAPCDGTFYLAKVGPQFAGEDVGDRDVRRRRQHRAGVSTVYPMMPSPTAAEARRSTCPAATVSSRPRRTRTPYINTSDLRIHTGERRVTVPTEPDSGDGSCGIRPPRSAAPASSTASGSASAWRSRPPTRCNAGASNNPEVEANTCWWGIGYRFTATPPDITTWQARVEGNPVHLTA